MASTGYTPEQAINRLTQAEVRIANGATTAQVCKVIGVTDQTHCQCRSDRRN